MLLTEEEMIRLWLLRKGYEPLRSDCRIERSDGADLDSIARQECRLWMEQLLAEGDPSLLVLHDVAKESSPALSISSASAIVVRLPENCVRPIAVKLQSWLSPATIVKPDSPLARRQFTPFVAGGVANPVAIYHPNRRLELFSPAYDNSDTLEYLLCVMRVTDVEGNPLYEFQPRALATL